MNSIHLKFEQASFHVVKLSRHIDKCGAMNLSIRELMYNLLGLIYQNRIINILNLQIKHIIRVNDYRPNFLKNRFDLFTLSITSHEKLELTFIHLRIGRDSC